MLVRKNGITEEISDRTPAIHAYLNNGWEIVTSEDSSEEATPAKPKTKKAKADK